MEKKVKGKKTLLKKPIRQQSTAMKRLSTGMQIILPTGRPMPKGMSTPNMGY